MHCDSGNRPVAYPPRDPAHWQAAYGAPGGKPTGAPTCRFSYCKRLGRHRIPIAGIAEPRATPTGTATWPHHAGLRTIGRLLVPAKRFFLDAFLIARTVLKRHLRSAKPISARQMDRDTGFRHSGQHIGMRKCTNHPSSDTPRRSPRTLSPSRPFRRGGPRRPGYLNGILPRAPAPGHGPTRATLRIAAWPDEPSRAQDVQTAANAWQAGRHTTAHVAQSSTRWNGSPCSAGRPGPTRRAVRAPRGRRRASTGPRRPWRPERWRGGCG